MNILRSSSGTNFYFPLNDGITVGIVTSPSAIYVEETDLGINYG